MAYSAATSKSRLISELSRARASSPRETEYLTASSFDPQHEAINSTIPMGTLTGTHQLPAQYDLYADHHSDGASEGSADMSIEIGRGVKDDARQARDASMSSNALFNFGNDSQYEVTGTPPIKARTPSQKTNGALRRDASIRRANEAANANEAVKRTASLGGKRHSSLSEALKRTRPADDRSDTIEELPAISVKNKNSRFSVPAVGLSQNSGKAGEHRRAVNPSGNPPTVQATFSTNSFMLPDLPDLTELVNGTREDGTPLRTRAGKNRSRFTPSASYRLPARSSNAVSHAAVESVPVPDEEKRIYASLQLLQDKIEYLEKEKAEASMRAEEYEGEILDLRSQLDTEQRLRRPDSALGSEEETEKEKSRAERIKLQSNNKALQDRINRSERKVSTSEIAVRRVIKERDELVTQIGIAFYNLEEVKAENELFRDNHLKLQEDNEDLIEEVESLRRENEELKAQLRVVGKPAMRGSKHDAVQSSKTSRLSDAIQSRKSQNAKTQAQPVEHDTTQQEGADDLLTGSFSRKLQQMKEQAAALAQGDIRERQSRRKSDGSRSRSKSQSRRQQEPTKEQRQSRTERQSLTVPKDNMGSDDEPTGKLEITKARSSTKQHKNDVKDKVVNVKAQEETGDITFIENHDDSWDLSKLRRRLERERRADHLQRHASAPMGGEHDTTSTNVAQRKSSMKDLTSGLTMNHNGEPAEEVTKAGKTVRLQSPEHHEETSDAIDDGHDETGGSLLSNISRRRRGLDALDSNEGETSAFIIPDITLHSTLLPADMTEKSTVVNHSTAACTVCAGAKGKHVDIPIPTPVSQRSDLGEDATLRPAQPPHMALAMVLKQLQDEVVHLKMQHARFTRAYHQHDPALGHHKRVAYHTRMAELQERIEKRSEQIYALYDVLEGQRVELNAGAGEIDGKKMQEMDEREVEETLMSIGIDPAEVSGMVGRKAPVGFDGLDAFSDGESADFPWEGLSDEE